MSNGVQNDQWETVQGGSPKELMDEVADGFGKALLHKGSKMRKLGNLTEAESILREAVEVFCLSSAGSLSFTGFGANPNEMEALSILLDIVKERGATEEEIDSVQEEYTFKLMSTQFMAAMRGSFTGETPSWMSPRRSIAPAARCLSSEALGRSGSKCK